ncbi:MULTISPECIES: FCD domain-containing protein [Pseudovibrio]|uniref:FCD domain-containing protein n=1 Tax=Stappiaceae TaxID=2821832 RepID=UPI00236541E0|nr:MULTISPECIES: FCD domain-containing protein [Pseudovibrio]MDD7911028.1 FCD domain-containing protein [Pseudovibrio exalbescens]MDX5593249.1 FCD domain-containing protein [Pseudovibrio sp. SPO723]
MTLDVNKRRYQDVAASLREELAQGKYAIGDRLRTERQISEELGVSRSLVRDAMIMLEVEGLVDVRKGSGIYVTRLPGGEGDADKADDIGPFELLQARQLLESNIAGFAAAMVTKADIIRMRELLDQERAELEAGGDAYHADELFHRQIAIASQNSVLVASVDNLWGMRNRSRMWERLHDRVFDSGYRQKWLEDHQSILTALQCRDPQMARQAMWQHLENVRLTLLELSDVDDPAFDAYLFDADPLAAVREA